MTTNIDVRAHEAVSSLRYAVGAANTVIECQVADQGYFPSTGYFYLILSPDDSARREIVLATTRTVQAITVTRGQLGTTAVVHPAGEKVAMITGMTISNMGLNIGSSGSPETYVAGTPVLALYTTNAGTSGSTNAEPFIFSSVLTGAGQVGGRAKFALTVEGAAGGWSNALKAQVTYGASGKTTGLGSAFCAELVLSAGTTDGTYAALEAEIVQVTGDSLGTATTFLYCNCTGTGHAGFEESGNFAILGDLTSAADGFWEDGTVGAPANIDEWVAWKTPAGRRWMALYNAIPAA